MRVGTGKEKSHHKAMNKMVTKETNIGLPCMYVSMYVHAYAHVYYHAIQMELSKYIYIHIHAILHTIIFFYLPRYTGKTKRKRNSQSDRRISLSTKRSTPESAHRVPCTSLYPYIGCNCTHNFFSRYSNYVTQIVCNS